MFPNHNIIADRLGAPFACGGGRLVYRRCNFTDDGAPLIPMRPGSGAGHTAFAAGGPFRPIPDSDRYLGGLLDRASPYGLR